MIRGNAGTEDAAKGVFFAGRSNGGGARGHRPGGLQRGEHGEFVGSGGHLGAQPVKDGEGGFFCAGGEIAGWADAGGAALFARASGDEFAGFLHEQSVRSKNSLAFMEIASSKRDGVKFSIVPSRGAACCAPTTAEVDSESAEGGRSPMAVPRSRRSHMRRRGATDSRAWRRPNMPLWRSLMVKGRDSRSGRSRVIQ